MGTFRTVAPYRVNLKTCPLLGDIWRLRHDGD